MKTQEWIAEGQYSSSILRRSACFFSKICIEGIVFASIGMFFAALVYLAEGLTPITIPQLPESMMALWVLFTAVVGQQGYCFLTEKGAD